MISPALMLTVRQDLDFMLCYVLLHVLVTHFLANKIQPVNMTVLQLLGIVCFDFFCRYLGKTFHHTFSIC